MLQMSNKRLQHLGKAMTCQYIDSNTVTLAKEGDYLKRLRRVMGVRVYSSVPGHRNWQIETAVWIFVIY